MTLSLALVPNWTVWKPRMSVWPAPVPVWTSRSPYRTRTFFWSLLAHKRSRAPPIPLLRSEPSSTSDRSPAKVSART